MMPILFVLLLSFFGCDAAAAQSPRDVRKELAAVGYKYDHRGQLVPQTDADRRMDEIINAVNETDPRAEQRQQRGDQARAILAQPSIQENDVNFVDQQPRPQRSVACYNGASTVNTYNGLPTCVCAPLVIKNGGAVCPLRCCCACKPCVLPRVVVAGCFGTNNSSLDLPHIQDGLYDQVAHLPELPGKKTTLNFAPESVGALVCLCGGCCFTVNQDNK